MEGDWLGGWLSLVIWPATNVNSAFYPSGLGRSSTGLPGWGLKWARSPVRQVIPHSSDIGFPWKARLYTPLTHSKLWTCVRWAEAVCSINTQEFVNEEEGLDMVDERVDYISSPRRGSTAVQKASGGPCACCFSCCRRSQSRVKPAEGKIIPFRYVSLSVGDIYQSISLLRHSAAWRGLRKTFLVP